MTQARIPRVAHGERASLGVDVQRHDTVVNEARIDPGQSVMSHEDLLLLLVL